LRSQLEIISVKIIAILEDTSDSRATSHRVPAEGSHHHRYRVFRANIDQDSGIIQLITGIL
jgi:hypothetical protein